nr:MAG TPA: hypothetical protein [Caudoviricetes sp.]
MNNLYIHNFLIFVLSLITGICMIIQQYRQNTKNIYICKMIIT